MDNLQKNSDEVNYFKGNKSILIGQNPYIFDETKIMGIVNLTDDSFFSGSRISGQMALLKKVQVMLEQGASFIDLGAYSTRPGAKDVDLQQESGRIEEAVTWLQKEFPEALLSIDTFRSEVARIGIESGAHLINDVSGGDMDPNMFKTVAQLKVPYIAMHMRGTPQTMQDHVEYEDVTKEVLELLNHKIQDLHEMGFNNLILDPGIGFAKTMQQNFELLKNIKAFTALNRPILMGISRKSFIQKTLNVSADEALNGTTALHSYLVSNHVDILRVHDVKEARQTVDLIKAMDLSSDKLGIIN